MERKLPFRRGKQKLFPLTRFGQKELESSLLLCKEADPDSDRGIGKLFNEPVAPLNEGKLARLLFPKPDIKELGKTGQPVQIVMHHRGDRSCSGKRVDPLEHERGACYERCRSEAFRNRCREEGLSRSEIALQRHDVAGAQHPRKTGCKQLCLRR